MSQQLARTLLLTTGQFCPPVCTCLPVAADCCNCPLPRCFYVTISGWGSGYIYAGVTTDIAVGWVGFIACDGCCPPIFWYVELSCDCDTDPPCGDDPDNCGWRIRVQGYFNGSTLQGVPGPPIPDPPEFNTGWQCADVQACNYPSESFGSIEHHFDEIFYGGSDVIVSLPPANKNCCLICCEVNPQNVNLTIEGASGVITLNEFAVGGNNCWLDKTSEEVTLDCYTDCRPSGNELGYPSVNGATLCCYHGYWWLFFTWLGCVYCGVTTDVDCDPFLLVFEVSGDGCTLEVIVTEAP